MSLSFRKQLAMLGPGGCARDDIPSRGSRHRRRALESAGRRAVGPPVVDPEIVRRGRAAQRAGGGGAGGSCPPGARRWPSASRDRGRPAARGRPRQGRVRTRGGRVGALREAARPSCVIMGRSASRCSPMHPELATCAWPRRPRGGPPAWRRATAHLGRARQAHGRGRRPQPGGVRPPLLRPPPRRPGHFHLVLTADRFRPEQLADVIVAAACPAAGPCRRGHAPAGAIVLDRASGERPHGAHHAGHQLRQPAAVALTELAHPRRERCPRMRRRSSTSARPAGVATHEHGAAVGGVAGPLREAEGTEAGDGAGGGGSVVSARRARAPSRTGAWSASRTSTSRRVSASARCRRRRTAPRAGRRAGSDPRPTGPGSRPDPRSDPDAEPAVTRAPNAVSVRSRIVRSVRVPPMGVS